MVAARLLTGYFLFTI